MPRSSAVVLANAADEIEQYVRGLNTHRSVCPSCNVYHYDNFAEYNAATELTAVVNKLRKHAAKFLRDENSNASRGA